METIYLPCLDGTDRDCQGIALIEDISGYEDLTDNQKKEVKRRASEYTKEDGDFDEVIDGIIVKMTPSVCGACGSDYSRDSNGEIKDE